MKCTSDIFFFFFASSTPNAYGGLTLTWLGKPIYIPGDDRLVISPVYLPGRISSSYLENRANRCIEP